MPLFSDLLTLLVLPETFAVCKLDPASAIPAWASAGPFSSITRTTDELSIVCSQDAVPQHVKCEPGWRCLRVAGTMLFSTIGVLANLTAALADAGISLFVVSTFDTDYLLLKADNLAAGIDALRRQGHTIY